MLEVVGPGAEDGPLHRAPADAQPLGDLPLRGPASHRLHDQPAALCDLPLRPPLFAMLPPLTNVLAARYPARR